VGIRVKHLHLPTAISATHPYVRACVTRFLSSRTMEENKKLPMWPSAKEYQERSKQEMTENRVPHTLHLEQLDSVLHKGSASQIFWYVESDEELDQDVRLKWNLRSQRNGNFTPLDGKARFPGFTTTCWNQQRVFSFLKPNNEPPGYNVETDLDLHFAVVTIYGSNIYVRDGVMPAEGVELAIGYAVVPLSDHRAPPNELPENPVAVHSRVHMSLMQTMVNDPAEAYTASGILMPTVDDDFDEWEDVHGGLLESKKWNVCPYIGVVEVETFAWAGPESGDEIPRLPKLMNDTFLQKAYRTLTLPPLQVDLHKLEKDHTGHLAIALDGARFVGIQYAFVVARIEVVSPSVVELCDIKYSLLDYSRVCPRFNANLVLSNLNALRIGETDVVVHLYGYRADISEFRCIGQSRIHVFARNTQREKASIDDVDACFINEGSFQLPVYGKTGPATAFERPRAGMTALVRLKMCADDEEVAGFQQNPPNFYTHDDGSPQYNYDPTADKMETANGTFYSALFRVSDSPVSHALDTLTNPGESKVKFMMSQMSRFCISDVASVPTVPPAHGCALPYIELLGAQSVMIALDRIAMRSERKVDQNPTIFMGVATVHSDILPVDLNQEDHLRVQDNTEVSTMAKLQTNHSIAFTKTNWDTSVERAQDFTEGFQVVAADCKFERRLVLVIQVKVSSWVKDSSRDIPFDLESYGWCALVIGRDYMAHRFVQSGAYVLPLYCGDVDDAYVHRLIAAKEGEENPTPGVPPMRSGAHVFVRVHDAKVGLEYGNRDLPRAEDVSAYVDQSNVPMSMRPDVSFFSSADDDEITLPNAYNKAKVSSDFVKLMSQNYK
jgi:hypothetical protein